MNIDGNNPSDQPEESGAESGTFSSTDSEMTNKPKKKRTTRLIWLFVFILLSYGAWHAYKLFNPEAAGPRINPLSLVPENALFVLETDQPYRLWSEVSHTNIWKLLQEDKEWVEYGQMMIELENTLSDFDQALDMLTNRKIYISSHPYRNKESDLLFVFDLEGMGVLQTWMTSLDNVTKRNFKGSTIYEKLDLDTKETLYFSFYDNFLIASYVHSLVESSLSSRDQAALMRSFDFIDIRKQVLGEGLVRIYLNYESLYAYLGKTIGEDESQYLKETLPFKFSGFYFDVDKEHLLLEGVSNYHDSLKTYMNLFPQSGTGGTEISRVIPGHSSVYLSFGFDSFSKFYKNLYAQISEDPESGEAYKSYARKTERFLGIDLEEDLASWLDDEIALVQFEMNNQSQSALIFKSKSASLANEKMTFLSRQIKRKTPVRFKAVEYQGYDINYMAVKGLFNLILGKIFTKYDRPYYTIIDKFVIFSDSPKVLRGIIDEWNSDNTLVNVPEFQEFVGQLGEEHSALLYMQLELLGESSGGLLDVESANYLKSKGNMISRFPQFGFNISPRKNMFETKLLMSIKGQDPELLLTGTMPFASMTIDYDSLFEIDPGEQIVIKEIEIEDFGAKKQSEAYEKGGPKYEVEIKDGMKHGDYFEYHPTGELSIKGKYKNDLKEGTWKYYSVDGKLEKKERYKKGELIGS